VTEGPCTVGLTGGLASGKSTVAALFARLGGSIFDCDAYVHELYRPNGAGAEEVRALFGIEVLDERGAVDRIALARRVLDDPEARLRLEKAIHPLVRNGVDEWLGTLPGESIAVVEAALLVETGWWQRYRLLVVVTCAPVEQLRRAEARGVPPDRARQMLAAQLPLEEKHELADVLIDNSGTREELDAEVRRAWSEILSLCGDNEERY
jgi:dephospho-CoA kinase